ncbi:glycosyltransferase family 2 protein [Duganella aceris]|uniref:Glycosyltransferase n=1 Tax=Duganella aceris TaxID=2703883 RepID=A0ABX0FTM2_9BURK|nr:glycosyltransferase [Duganella aceris]NGZ88047.1 glycosyltransferase [Duganella aceris]
MLLSVIVPCYNVGVDIQRLLRSITTQLASDCELVLVDDGSTDDTAAQIDAFVAGYTGAGHIVARTTPNAGAAKARAHGLTLASGEFIYFCDSDDIFQPDFVATFRRSLAEHPGMDLLYFSSDVVVADGDGLRRVAPKVAYRERHVFRQGGELLAHNLAQGMYTAAVWTFVARRALIERSNAVFTPRKAHEDHLYTLRAIMGARLIVAVPDLLYRQKIRIGSLTQSKKNSAYLVDRITAYQEADAFLRECGFPQRAAYDRWSLRGMLSIIKENRALLPAVLLRPAGASMVRLGLKSLLTPRR